MNLRTSLDLLKIFPDLVKNRFNFKINDEILYHPNWQINRINFISKNYHDHFLNSKTLVNMGAFEGDLSFLIHKKFRHLSILNEEGRSKNIEKGSKKYPYFQWHEINYEKYD